MAGVSFSTLWSNYSTRNLCINPKTGKSGAYENQCAMRVGYALELSGVSFASYKGSRCPFSPSSGGIVRGAQDLANWISPKTVPGCSKAESYDGQTLFDKISGRTGIVFLANFWQTDDDKGKDGKGEGRNGDHIDLWNGIRFTSFSSLARVHLGISYDGLFSDYRRASRSLFWYIP